MTESASPLYLSDIKEGAPFVSVFAVRDKIHGKDKNGRSFLSLTLVDRSGFLNARMFENVDEVKDNFENGDCLKVKGHLHQFQGQDQIVVHQIQKPTEDEIQSKDYVPVTDAQTDVLYEKVLTLVESFQNDPLREMCLLCLKDPGVKEKLLVSPAAKTIHHAHQGGLIEHIYSICQLMEFLAGHYPWLSRDLLLFGAIFHDIGKIYELEVKPTVHYSTRGRLVGHMALACEMIDTFSRKILAFPEELKDILKHIILSHHGKLEYGSPKLPSLPEAEVIAMIDELDSRVDTIFSFLKSESGHSKDWTRYHAQLDRVFYLSYFRENYKK